MDCGRNGGVSQWQKICQIINLISGSVGQFAWFRNTHGSVDYDLHEDHAAAIQQHIPRGSRSRGNEGLMEFIGARDKARTEYREQGVLGEMESRESQAPGP